MPDLSLCPKTYDPFGTIELNTINSPGLADRQRRVSIVKTLDGGVAVTDGGLAHGDRRLQIRTQVSPADAEVLTHLVDTYGEINVSLAEGFFTAVPADVSFRGALATLTLLMISKDG
jgi:hypothetical protein